MISLRHDLCMNHKLVSLSSSFMVLGQTPHKPPQQGERRDTVRSLSLSAVQCKSIQFNPFWFSPRNILLLLFSRSVVSDSLRPHGPQHPGFSVLHHLLEFAQCLLSRWCHPTILSFVVPFSFFPQSFLSSRSFLMSWLFTSGGQSIEASPSVLPVNVQGWFSLGWPGFRLFTYLFLMERCLLCNAVLLFFHTSAWISHRYTHISSLFNLLHPSPPFLAF